MPPRRSSRVGAVAEHATSALSQLPLPLVLHIFSLLPVDCRLRCAEVCRGWRSVLLDRSLWTRLDLSPSSGVRTPQQHAGNALDALLRCAAARAGGGLQWLHIEMNYFTQEALLAVATANAGALLELHASDFEDDLGFTLREAQQLIAAAPQLRVFATVLVCEDVELQAARAALRNEAPFAALRVRHLYVDFPEGDEDAAGVVAFAADVAAHESLTGLFLEEAPLHVPAALDAVVDAALARRLHIVSLRNSHLTPASMPALVRLLSSDALTTLKCSRMDLLDAPAASMLAAALRANSRLTSLTLNYAGVFDDTAAGAELLGALTGHISLQVLHLRHNDVAAENRAAAGAALGALVAANAPALTYLNIPCCALGDIGLRPLFEALPQNTHLRTLYCYGNGMSKASARVVLLPAVRANTSLTTLWTGTGVLHVGAVEAEAIVRSRAAA
jgi:hypothetical protein